MSPRLLSPALGIALLCALASASSGDPQLKTDHPWYPGELSCSNFQRLFKTQADLYKRVTGRGVESDEDKALASWYWRNLNYFHSTEGACNYWGTGFYNGDLRNREYWAGLFAHGMGLCGTTHSQWQGELNLLLGPGKHRVCGVPGHNSFEVFLTGGEYGEGKWVLLDHDVSTVMFDKEGKRLISISEIAAEFATYKNPNFKAERQRGWRVAGLHPSDTGVFNEFKCAEYNSGYAAVPPMVQLRAGESLRRYLRPGLEDGKTFVFWGYNFKAGGIPGPNRNETWVNQPEKMYKATASSPSKVGQARFANAVYTYSPDFKSEAYKEGVVSEADNQVTFEFYSPFIIAATPANDKPMGVYDAGGKNGLILKGKAQCPVKISTDQGKSWQDCGAFSDGLDLTDAVKGHFQYWIQFATSAKALAEAGLTMRTVCQCNGALIPHLKDGDNAITFLSSGLAVLSNGPNKNQAKVVDGALDTRAVTIELATPRKEKAVRLHVGAHIASSCPPDSSFKYQAEFSTDSGKSWEPVVKDWQIVRRQPEPKDFWSQSLMWGEVALKDVDGPVRVRFKNDGGKAFKRVEAHLVYRVHKPGATEVAFAWKEGGVLKTDKKLFEASQQEQAWQIKCGTGIETVWVEQSAK